jgi:hypothetical protein
VGASQSCRSRGCKTKTTINVGYLTPSQPHGCKNKKNKNFQLYSKLFNILKRNQHKNRILNTMTNIEHICQLLAKLPLK